MNTSLFLSVFLGGILISLLSTVNTIYIQKEEFQPKSAVRDFFIGTLLVTFLYQLVPETVTDIGTMLSDVKLPTMNTISMKGGSSAGSNEFKLQVGVPRF